MAHGADHMDKCWSEKKKFFFKSLSLGEMEQGKGRRELVSLDTRREALCSWAIARKQEDGLRSC